MAAPVSYWIAVSVCVSRYMCESDQVQVTQAAEIRDITRIERIGRPHHQGGVTAIGPDQVYIWTTQVCYPYGWTHPLILACLDMFDFDPG